jgi:hypothetical protein
VALAVVEMKADIVQVGTFSTSGHPVAWKFSEPLTIGVTKKGKALYCGWTVDELQAYRAFEQTKASESEPRQE